MASAAAFLSTPVHTPSPDPGWELSCCQNNLEVTVMERTPGCKQSCWGFRASRHTGAPACGRFLRTSWVFLTLFFFLTTERSGWNTNSIWPDNYLWSIYYAPSTIWNPVEGKDAKDVQGVVYALKEFIGFLPRKRLTWIKQLTWNN